MTDTNSHRFNDCGVICFGGVKPTDTHLAVAIRRVKKVIIGWLEPAALCLWSLEPSPQRSCVTSTAVPQASAWGQKRRNFDVRSTSAFPPKLSIKAGGADRHSLFRRADICRKQITCIFRIEFCDRSTLLRVDGNVRAACSNVRLASPTARTAVQSQASKPRHEVQLARPSITELDRIHFQIASRDVEALRGHDLLDRIMPRDI
jgi:hypothetical protein